jgi:N-acetyl-gamma-glutamyl-phosphate reductase
MIRAGIYGATGYTGWELVKILQRHPAADIAFVATRSQAGKTLRDLFPAAPPLPLVAGADAPLDEADVVFLCLPHAAAAETALIALAAGKRVIDLSADFRLRDAATYAHWYNHTHPAPALLAEAVYGLTEVCRAELPGARLVANPGCYPTSVLLALRPLLCSDVPLAGPIIADSVGRQRRGAFAGADQPLRRGGRQLQRLQDRPRPPPPAGDGAGHRRLAGRRAAARLLAPPAARAARHPVHDLRDAGRRRETRPTCAPSTPRPMTASRSSSVLPPGETASLAHVTHTNRCAIGLTLVGRTLILTSAIDNLIKGAAGQAVQNMNAMYGIDETAGF